MGTWSFVSMFYEYTIIGSAHGVCGLVCMYFTQGMLGHFFYSRTIRDCYYRPTAAKIMGK